MSDNKRDPVTVIGLGPMGSALATAFIGSGHPTTVWNRTASKAEPLVEKGARKAETAADAVAASPVLIICVISDDVVHQILDPVADRLQGKTVVNLTADSPDRARATAAWAAERDIAYLDGAIMTPDVTIGRPEAVFLYSGPEGVYDAHRRTLAALGGTATYVGADPGRAAAFDVALLDIFWTGMTGVVHGLALAHAEGISSTELLPFAQGIVGLTAELTAEIAKDADNGHYPGDGSTVRSNAASMAHIVQASQARGLDASVMRSALGIADRVVAAGHGDDGFARMVEVLGRKTKVGVYA